MQAVTRKEKRVGLDRLKQRGKNETWQTRWGGGGQTTHEQKERMTHAGGLEKRRSLHQARRWVASGIPL